MSYTGQMSASDVAPYIADAEAPKKQARIPAAFVQLEEEQAFTEKLLAELEQRLRPALAPSRPQAEGKSDTNEGPRVEIEGVVLNAAFRQYNFNAFIKDILQRLEI